jgi:hypothetical protein
MPEKEAIIEIDGATHPSCVRALERAAHRLKGLIDIDVEAGNREIRLRYTSNHRIPHTVARFVKQLGYEARVRCAYPTPSGAGAAGV